MAPPLLPVPGLAGMPTNRLLAVMPEDALARLRPAMTPVALMAGEVLYDAGHALKQLYFPLDAIATLVVLTKNGDATKVAVVGNEGIVGVSAYMGGGPPGRAVVLTAGLALRIGADALKAEFDRNGAVMRLLLRYTQSLVTQMAQTAVCNRHHRLEQQLCSWLLACLDRLPGDDIPVTQEAIASELGVRREGVTEAAGALRQRGLITHRRGCITVLDREGVLARACECYAAARQETERLLPNRLAV